MSRTPALPVAAVAVALALALAACQQPSAAPGRSPSPAPSPSATPAPSSPSPTPEPAPASAPTSTASPAPAPAPPPPAPAAGPEPAAPPAAVRPAWLGTRVLPLRADGFGEVQPTPPELVDRRLPPAAALPAPPDGAFRATIDTVPDEVVARSTWSAACPVALEDLRYLTLTYWGFDEQAHTGELLVAASAADDLAGVFARLYQARFPIEDMVVTTPAELDAPPTGDGGATAAFVCRPTTGGSSWSQHAYGLAVDVNPFHNPYVRGDLVVPELASAYTDRTWRRPGMIVAGDAVTEAFAAIGWGWGGDWRSLTDSQHFSANGR